MGGGLYLAVDKCPELGYHELVVWLENKDGVYLQDVAVIGQEYIYDSNLNVINGDTLNIKVWGDPDSDEYTWEFSGIELNNDARDAFYNGKDE